jgi:hypothetical protein
VTRITGRFERDADIVQFIDALMYYEVDFRAWVDWQVLPPRLLYWHVHAVFAIFGNKVDSKTKKPLLFNVQAWKKANNIMKEILLEYYSNPIRYSNHLDQKASQW